MLKVLTAHNTNAPQPDFFWCVEGEVVIPELNSPALCRRPDCGCDRSHFGLNSHRGTTTVMVREVDLHYADVVMACRAFIANAGWEHATDDPDDLADCLASQTVECAADFPSGTVLRPRFNRAARTWVYEVVSAP